MRTGVEKMTEFWISKYALSHGIFSVEAEEPTENMVVERAKELGCDAYYHVEGRDWHRTKEAANKKADAMRVAKIASLEKQIGKLAKLKFV
jgi:hypothetical protein